MFMKFITANCNSNNRKNSVVKSRNDNKSTCNMAINKICKKAFYLTQLYVIVPNPLFSACIWAFLIINISSDAWRFLLLSRFAFSTSPLSVFFAKTRPFIFPSVNLSIDRFRFHSSTTLYYRTSNLLHPISHCLPLGNAVNFWPNLTSYAFSKNRNILNTVEDFPTSWAIYVKNVKTQFKSKMKLLEDIKKH